MALNQVVIRFQLPLVWSTTLPNFRLDRKAFSRREVTEQRIGAGHRSYCTQDPFVAEGLAYGCAAGFASVGFVSVVGPAASSGEPCFTIGIDSSSIEASA